MSVTGDLEVKGVQLSLEPSGQDKGLRPVIHGGEVSVPNAGFVKIVSHLLSGDLDVPQIDLRFVSCKLIDGGAEIVMKAKRGFLDGNVRASLALAPAGNGDLRVTIADLAVGRLPAGWLLDYVLEAVERVEGLRKAGSRAIDVNLATLLRSHDVPVDLASGVSAVEATAQTLTLRLS